MRYRGVGPERSRRVAREDAAAYAMARVGVAPLPGVAPDPEFLQALEEWYFSGNWICEDADDELFA